MLAALREHYVRRVAPDTASTLRALTAARAEENELITSQLEVMVMRELPEPRPTFVLARGAYDAPTTPVTPGTPAFLPPFGADLPRNRLGLARWLVDPANPMPYVDYINGEITDGGFEVFLAGAASGVTYELLWYVAGDYLSTGDLVCDLPDDMAGRVAIGTIEGRDTAAITPVDAQNAEACTQMNNYWEE